MEQNEEKVVELKDQNKNNKNLFLAGFLSALAGLGGCLLLGVLLAVGFVASISGIVISLAMFYTFQKFYKTNSKWLYVYIVGVAIIEIFLTVLIADGIIVKILFMSSQNVIITLSDAIAFIFSESELVGAFVSDFLLAVLFALMGMAFVIYSLVQTKKRNQAVSSLNQQNKNNDTVFTPATVVQNDEQKVEGDKVDEDKDNNDTKSLESNGDKQ